MHCPLLYSGSLYKHGQDFLGLQYTTNQSVNVGTLSDQVEVGRISSFMESPQQQKLELIFENCFEQYNFSISWSTCKPSVKKWFVILLLLDQNLYEHKISEYPNLDVERFLAVCLNINIKKFPWFLDSMLISFFLPLKFKYTLIQRTLAAVCVHTPKILIVSFFLIMCILSVQVQNRKHVYCV